MTWGIPDMNAAIRHKLDEIHFIDTRDIIKQNIQRGLDEMATKQIVKKDKQKEKQVKVDAARVIQLYRAGYSIPKICYCAIVGDWDTRVFKNIDTSKHIELMNKINNIILEYKEMPINRQIQTKTTEITDSPAGELL